MVRIMLLMPMENDADEEAVMMFLKLKTNPISIFLS
jgi:hypothetical protein